MSAMQIISSVKVDRQCYFHTVQIHACTNKGNLIIFIMWCSVKLRLARVHLTLKTADKVRLFLQFRPETHFAACLENILTTLIQKVNCINIHTEKW